MERSQRALLSPHEEITLRRVALGISSPENLSTSDLRRLRHLLLVVDVGGRPELTTLGRRRYFALPRAVEIADAAKSDAIGLFEHYIRKARQH